MTFCRLGNVAPKVGTMPTLQTDVVLTSLESETRAVITTGAEGC